MVGEGSTYNRMALAIAYMQDNFKAQPSLAEVAQVVDLSASHFQRLFTDWAGVSPKKFMQYLSVEYAKSRLNNNQTLLNTAYDVGLSGTGRLHDLFVNIEAMTPGDYKNGGRQLSIQYSFQESLFGKVIVASTPKGVCHLFFEDNDERALCDLKIRFPNANFTQKTDAYQQSALEIFRKNWNHLDEVKLHLKGTDFQLKVWQALLNIPEGAVTTYGAISKSINRPSASRAVGTAIGSNPVAFLIPCHRVIQATGGLGGYMWGPSRKSSIIAWEAAQVALLKGEG